MNRNILLEALNFTKPALAKSGMWEQSQYFHFDGENVSTCNDIIYMKYPFKGEITGAVKGDEFHRIISKLPGDEIEIEQDEQQIIIKCQRAKAKINIVQFEEFLNIKPKKNSRIKLPEDFWETAKFCSFSVDKSLNHPQLSCLWINEDTIVSCDNKRVTKKKMNGNAASSFLLPVEGIPFDCDLNRYNVDDSWIHFLGELGNQLSCRVVPDEGMHKQTLKYFEVEGTEFTLPTKLIDVISRADILAQPTIKEQYDKQIKIIISNGKVTCQGEGDVGFFEETIRTRYKGDLIEFTIHPDFLAEILPHLQTAVIGENKILFSGESFDHVISIEQG